MSGDFLLGSQPFETRVLFSLDAFASSSSQKDPFPTFSFFEMGFHVASTTKPRTAFNSWPSQIHLQSDRNKGIDYHIRIMYQRWPPGT